MSSNKGVRLQLERIYGKGCMFQKAQIEQQIDELNKIRKKKIKTYRKYKSERRFSSKRIQQLEKLISVHHLRHRSENGETSVKNCTNINRLAHDYIHSIPREDEEVINDMLREYKDKYAIAITELRTDRIKPLQVIELGNPRDSIKIRLEDNTPEDEVYLKHKRERNQRVIEKLSRWEVSRDDE